MAKLTDVEGIGPVLAEKLKSAGAGSTDTLLKMGATKKGRQELAAASGVDEKRVLTFVNHCDLMRIKGIGGEYSELLEAAGVDSVPALKGRNPANLHAAIVKANDEKKLVRQVASADQVAGWVEQAKGLERVVTH